MFSAFKGQTGQNSYYQYYVGLDKDEVEVVYSYLVSGNCRVMFLQQQR